MAPTDAAGEAATLNNYLGSWTVQGTQIQDCAGQAQTSTIRDPWTSK